MTQFFAVLLDKILNCQDQTGVVPAPRDNAIIHLYFDNASAAAGFTLSILGYAGRDCMTHWVVFCSLTCNVS